MGGTHPSTSREASNPTLDREHRAIVIGGGHGRSLLDYLKRNRVDCLAGEITSSGECLHLVANDDLDRVQSLISAWLKGTDGSGAIGPPERLR